MKTKLPLKATIAFLAAITGSLSLWAGALHLQVVRPDAEAQQQHAVLTAIVTACKNPAKAALTANRIEMKDGKPERTPLHVVALRKAGTFAVVGDAAQNGAIEMTVAHPEYGDYKSTMLVRTDATGVEWQTVARYGGNAPDADKIRAFIETRTVAQTN